MLTVLIFWNRKFFILELLRKSPDSSSLTCNFNVFVSYDLKQFFEKPSFLLQKNLSAFFKKKAFKFIIMIISPKKFLSTLLIKMIVKYIVAIFLRK